MRPKGWEHSHRASDAALAYQIEVRKAEIAIFCERVLPHLRGVARSLGYALTEHGSKARDLDLVAVPWAERAESPERLVEALQGALAPLTGWGYRSDKEFTQKPHGRIATTIIASGEVSLDLSIMPRQPKVAVDA